MARAVSNVTIATDSFATWIGVTNFMADTLTNYALTANLSSSGASTTGNAALIGTFNANTIAVGTVLRGGTVATSANLNITSNVIFTGATINATSNVNVTTTNTYINSAVTYVVGGAANVTSNVSVTNANTSINATNFFVVGGTANVTSNVSITNANTNINATAFSVQGVSVVTGNTTLKANSSLSSVVLTSNATISNLAISVDQLTVAGNVNFDSGTMFVDAANNRLGIKNTTPDAELTVTGSANVSAAAWVGTTLTVVNAASIGNNFTVTGTANVSTAVNVGANVNLSTSQINIGNSTGNSVLSQSYLTVGNTTVGTVNAFALNIGANVNVSTSQINIGNSTGNCVLTQSTLTVGNTTVGTVNAFALNIGANVNVTTTQLNVGNTTVNSVVESNSIKLGNTTVNTAITGNSIITNGYLSVSGNATFSNVITVTGNATFSNVITVTGATTLSNTLTTTGNATFSNVVTVTGSATLANTIAVTGNATFSNAVAVTGPTTLTGALATTANTTLQTDVVLAVISNTNIGSNTTGPQEIFNFPIASYTGAKITAKIGALSGANSQVQELILVQNTTDVVMTVYGTVASPAAANLGVFSAAINTTAVSVKFQQTGANSSVKLFTQLIK